MYEHPTCAEIEIFISSFIFHEAKNQQKHPHRKISPTKTEHSLFPKKLSVNVELGKTKIYRRYDRTAVKNKYVEDRSYDLAPPVTETGRN